MGHDSILMDQYIQVTGENILKTRCNHLLIITCLITTLAGCSLFSSKVDKQNELLSMVQVSISPNFSMEHHKTIVILPFEVKGENYKKSVTEDKFALYCMKAGFRVIDTDQIRKIMPKSWDIGDEDIPSEYLDELQKKLGVDMIVTGTLFCSGNWLGKPYLAGESVKFTDIKTGEILIAAFCKREDDTPLSLIIGKAITRKINELSNNK